MNDLTIKQNTQIKETNVPASTITKLVLLSKSGTDMELVGWIGILGGIKKSEKDYMDQHYGNNGKLLEWLTIDAPKIYLDFEDPAVETIMMSVASSDGVGVTVEDAAALLNNLFPSFENNTNITSFDELKEFTNVTQLTSNFRGCTNLTSVDLSNIQVIGHQSFTNSGITGVVNLPALVRFNYSYPMCPFYGCNNITEINIGPNLLDSTGISTDSTLSGCPNLKKITGLNNITVLGGNSTFSGDTNLEYIDLDFSKLTILKRGTFYNCKKLFSNLDLSQTNITEIGNECFYGCTSLLSITLPNTLITISNQAFFSTGLTSINIPSGVTSIGNSVFNSCTSLTSVTIPDSVTSIGVSAFQNCSGLTSCTIGSGVTSIDGFTFYNCRSLTSIEIPDSVTSIGQQAFESCRSLTSIAIPDSVTSIGYRAFAQCSGLTSCIIGSGVTSIGNNTFEGCGGLKSCTIGSGVTSIGNGAFSGCTQLLHINLPESIIQLGDGTFNYCQNLLIDEINLPNLEVLDGNNTFGNCKKIKHVVNLGKIIEIPIAYDGCFINCTELLDATLPATLTSINTAVFRGCTNLNWIKLLSETLPTYSHTDKWDRTNYYCFGEQWTNGVYSGQTYPIYVKDELLSQYQAADGWKDVGPNRLRPLSQFATDFPNG